MTCERRRGLSNIDRHHLLEKQFPKWNLHYRNQLNEGLKMKQVHGSIDKSPLSGKSAKEIIEHFKSYNFVDDHGHRLDMCLDFTDLVEMAASAKE